MLRPVDMACDVLLNKIDEKKRQLDVLRPLPSAVVKNLDEWFTVELTYNSNAIEGNTLTKRETALVIEKGLTIGGKTIREHLEAINHASALDFVKELAQRKRSHITLNDILDIHRIILRGIDDEHAGRFRKVQVFIAGSDIMLPHPLKVPDLMDDFIAWLHTTQEHPVKVAADAHFKLVAIHPFVDGDGRTAQLLMNLLLIQAGYVPVVVPFAQRIQYIDAIELGERSGNLAGFYRLIFNAEIKSLDKYLEALGI